MKKSADLFTAVMNAIMAVLALISAIASYDLFPKARVPALDPTEIATWLVATWNTSFATDQELSITRAVDPSAVVLNRLQIVDRRLKVVDQPLSQVNIDFNKRVPTFFSQAGRPNTDFRIVNACQFIMSQSETLTKRNCGMGPSFATIYILVASAIVAIVTFLLAWWYFFRHFKSAPAASQNP